MCPVKTYDLYVSRLDPRQPRLWQTPKAAISWSEEIWYTTIPLGKTKIQDLRPTLYINAGLSKRYTNHCIRSTVVGLLDRGKFGTRKIMRWVGHKSENSIRSYAHTTSSAEKKEMADYLSSAVMGKENEPPKQENKAIENKPQEEFTTNPSNVANLSFGQLLQLTPEEEQNVLKDLFLTEIEVPANNNVVQNVQNVAQPVSNLIPKMMFNNSTVTINFNVTK